MSYFRGILWTVERLGGTATKALTIAVNGGGGGTPAGSFAKALHQVIG